MKTVATLVLSVFSAFPAYGIECDYQFVGVPFSKIQLEFSADGTPDDFVTISVQGRAHRESYTPVAADAGEQIHGWISRESPDNSIEMIIFREMQKFGRSKIINHHISFGQEIWGACSTARTE